MSIPSIIKRVKPEIESIDSIPDLKLIRPKAFPDDRGFFVESYNVEEWKELLDFDETFKQVSRFGEDVTKIAYISG